MFPCHRSGTDTGHSLAQRLQAEERQDVQDAPENAGASQAHNDGANSDSQASDGERVAPTREAVGPDSNAPIVASTPTGLYNKAARLFPHSLGTVDVQRDLDEATDAAQAAALRVNANKTSAMSNTMTWLSHVGDGSRAERKEGSIERHDVDRLEAGDTGDDAHQVSPSPNVPAQIERLGNTGSTKRALHRDRGPDNVAAQPKRTRT